MINISNSIEAEAKHNLRLSAMNDFGMATGLGWCIAQLLSLAPGVAGQIAGLVAVCLWVIHWRFIKKVNKLLIGSAE